MASSLPDFSERLEAFRRRADAGAPDTLNDWTAEPEPEQSFSRWGVPVPAVVGVVLVAVLVVGGAALMLLRPSSPGEIVPTTTIGDGGQPASASVAPVTPSASPVSSPSVAGARVYVVGQVREPGVVTLPAGARVEDAVDAAGGATGRADLTVINLARLVQDGEQIVVPKPGESVAPVPAPGGSAAAPGAGAGSSAAGPVNLNAATVADLDALPGVGPVIAQRIVDWRQQNGGFTSVDDLGEVSGIGDATLAKLRPLVTV